MRARSWRVLPLAVALVLVPLTPGLVRADEASAPTSLLGVDGLRSIEPADTVVVETYQLVTPRTPITRPAFLRKLAKALTTKEHP